jgi:hypothetical protein
MRSNENNNIISFGKHIPVSGIVTITGLTVKISGSDSLNLSNCINSMQIGNNTCPLQTIRELSLTGYIRIMLINCSADGDVS